MSKSKLKNHMKNNVITVRDKKSGNSIVTTYLHCIFLHLNLDMEMFLNYKTYKYFLNSNIIEY